MLRLDATLTLGLTLESSNQDDLCCQVFEDTSKEDGDSSLDLWSVEALVQSVLDEGDGKNDVVVLPGSRLGRRHINIYLFEMRCQFIQEGSVANFA